MYCVQCRVVQCSRVRVQSELHMLMPVKYKIPGNFFNPGTQFRLPALRKSLEQLPLYQYDQPEACNLHETTEVHLFPHLL